MAEKLGFVGLGIMGKPPPLTALVDQMLQAMRIKGYGGEDHSALPRIIEDLAQHTSGEQTPSMAG